MHFMSFEPCFRDKINSEFDNAENDLLIDVLVVFFNLANMSSTVEITIVSKITVKIILNRRKLYH
jgi:hypothetical protein